MSQHELVVCSKCRSFKPVNAFVVDRSKKSGRTSQCKTCRYPQSREWKTQNCERQNLAQRRYRKRATSVHRGIKKSYQGDDSWWEIFDNQRALQELRELGDGFRLMSKKLSRRSVLEQRRNYSLQEIEDLIVNAIEERELSEADRLELFMAFIILKMNGKGIWINFFILSS